MARLRSVMSHVLWMFKLLLDVGPLLTVGIMAITLLAGLLPALSVRVTQWLIDAIATAVRMGEPPLAAVQGIAGWLGLSLAIAMVRHLMSHGERLAQKALSDRVTFRLNMDLLEKVQRLDYAFFETPSFYDQMQRAQQESSSRPMMMLYASLGVVRNAITLVSLLGLFSVVHWGLPAMLLLAALPTGYLTYTFGMQQFRMKSWRTPEGRRMNYIAGLLTGQSSVKEIRLFQAERYLLGQYADLFQKVNKAELQLQVRRSGWALVAEAGRLVTYACAYGFLVWSLSGSGLTFGAFVALSQAVGQAQTVLDDLFQSGGAVLENSMFLSDIVAFLALPVRPSREETLQVSLDGEIRAEGLTFVYPESDSPALHEIRFALRPGEKVALVGENGAGKTTLVKLLAGLYQPTGGEIHVGGTRLQDVPEGAWRSHIAVLFQDFVQYLLTARENIGFGDLTALQDDGRIRRAAEQAGAHGFIARLSRGYDSYLGRAWEGGHQLSGGQWQKVALARAFIRQARFLILDEPTASLDPRAEALLFETLRQLAEGKTTLFISHRIGSARLADRILVLKGGRLVEQGTHDDLVALNGEYARLFLLQAQWYQ